MKRLHLEAESSPSGLWGKPGGCLGDMQADLILSGKPQATPILSVTSACPYSFLKNPQKPLQKGNNSLECLLDRLYLCPSSKRKTYSRFFERQYPGPQPSSDFWLFAHIGVSHLNRAPPGDMAGPLVGTWEGQLSSKHRIPFPGQSPRGCSRVQTEFQLLGRDFLPRL